MEEASRIVSDVIYIIKKEGQVSEQVLPLLVNSFDISALEGKQSPPYIYLPMASGSISNDCAVVYK